MTGSIRQRSRNSWELKWYMGIDEGTGKKSYRTQTVKGTRKDAERERRRILSAIDAGSYVQPSNRRVSDGLEEWLSHIRQNVGAKTFQEYQKIVRNYVIPALGKHHLETLKPHDIQKYYDDAQTSGGKHGNPLSAQTVKHHHRVIKQAFQYLVDMEIMSRNPARTARPPKVDQYDAQVLSPKELLVLLGAAKDTIYYSPLLVAVFTACRRGEILALRWHDIDFEEKTISVERSLEQTAEFGLRVKQPKTKMSKRIIPVGSMLINELAIQKTVQHMHKAQCYEAYEDNDLVCANQLGGFLNPSTLSRHFMEIRRKAGLKPVRFHDLRHSHLTALIPEVSLKLISSRAGHSTVKTTGDIYCNDNIEMGRIAADAFERLMRSAEGKLDTQHG